MTRFEGQPVIRVCHPGDARQGCDVEQVADALALANDGDRIEIVGDGSTQGPSGTSTDSGPSSNQGGHSGGGAMRRSGDR